MRRLNELLRKKTMKAKLLLFFALCSFLVNAQESDLRDNPYQNRAVLKFYTGPELSQLESDSPVEFEKVRYYFGNSFSVVRTDCENCAVDYTTFFNIDLFNIREFENIRMEEDVIEINYRDKYSVTLYSKKAVRVKYDELENSSASMRIASTSMPEYVNTGDAAQDYETYRNQLQDFVQSNIEDYEIHTSKPGFLVISVSEFNSLPAARQNSVLNHPAGYMITD